MSQPNYFYQEYTPNIVVPCLENINKNIPANEIDFVKEYPGSSAPTSQNGVSLNSTELLIPPATRTPLTNTQFTQGCELEWQNAVRNQPVATSTTAWYNFNQNYQDCQSSVMLPRNYEYNYCPMPQYLGPYFPTHNPVIHEQYLQHNTHVTKNAVNTKSYYDEIVDSFVKSNLESLKKVNYKEKHIMDNKEVILKKQTKSQKISISPKQIISPKENVIPKSKMQHKKIIPLKKVQTPKKQILSDIVISVPKVKTTNVPKTLERSPNWASRYLQSIGQNHTINVKSKTKIAKETKITTDSTKITTDGEKPVTKTANKGNINKYEDTLDEVKGDTMKKSSLNIKSHIKHDQKPVKKENSIQDKNEIEYKQKSVKKEKNSVQDKSDVKRKNKSVKKERALAQDKSKEKVKKAITPNKHKKTESNSKINKSKFEQKIKESVFTEKNKVFLKDKNNILDGNTTLPRKLPGKESSKCSTNLNIKINKVNNKPNSLMRSSKLIPLDRKQKSESINENTQEDLRTILDGKKILRKHCEQIRAAHTKTLNNSFKKANEKKAKLRKPINKIKLVINIVHNNQEELRHSDESSSHDDSHEDVSFLDDLDVNVLIDCLNDSSDKMGCKDGKDNTQQEDNLKALEMDNLRSYEKDPKVIETNENVFKECAIEKQLACIFSERSKVTSPKKYRANGDSLKRKTGPENSGNINCAEVNGNSKRACVKKTNEIDNLNATIDKKVIDDGFNRFEYIALRSGVLKNNVQNFSQNSYDSTNLKIESMIAQIHGEEIPKLGKPDKHDPNPQFDFIDLTIKKETVEYINIKSNVSNQVTEGTAETKNYMFIKEESHGDKILNKTDVPLLLNTQHINRQKLDETSSVDVTCLKLSEKSEFDKLLKTVELIGVQKCKEPPSILDERTQPKTTIQEIKDTVSVPENKLNNISSKTCTKDDKNKGKFDDQNNEAKDDSSPDQSTLKPCNKSPKAEITSEICKVNTEYDVTEKAINKTTRESATVTNKAEMNIFTKTYDQVLVSELEKRMLKYLQEEFKVISKLHEGNFSNIYKCMNSKQKRFAIKVLKTVDNVSKVGIEKEKMMFTYQNEIPKENLNCVYLVNSFGVSNSRWAFLMEYYPRNVQQYLQNSGSFHIDLVQKLAQQLVSALLMLRSYKIVHSDIKPNHILINGAGTQIKLCGFDRSYYTHPPVVLPNIGSTSYRAPEVILGYSASFGIDVWALAAVLYEMVTCAKLFPGFYNNDILFKQMCLCGNMPQFMILNGNFSKKHFINSTFMRQVGVCGEKRVPVKHFSSDDNLGLCLYNAYARDWVGSRNVSQVNKDAAKLQTLQYLMEQMLQLDPTKRLKAAEFVFANPFFQK